MHFLLMILAQEGRYRTTTMLKDEDSKGFKLVLLFSNVFSRFNSCGVSFR